MSRRDSHEPYDDPDPTEWLGAEPPAREQGDQGREQQREHSWQAYPDGAPQGEPAQDIAAAEPTRFLPRFRRGQGRRAGRHAAQARPDDADQHDQHDQHGQYGQYGQYGQADQPGQSAGPDEAYGDDPGLFTQLLDLGGQHEPDGGPAQSPYPGPAHEPAPGYEPASAYEPTQQVQYPKEPEPGPRPVAPEPPSAPAAEPVPEPAPVPAPARPFDLPPVPEPTQAWPPADPAASDRPSGSGEDERPPRRRSRREQQAQPAQQAQQAPNVRPVQHGPSAREEILGRVRAAVGGRPEPDGDVPRSYRRSLGLSRDEAVALFAERVADYQARVRRIPADQLPAVIAVCLVERAIRRIAVPADLPRAWLPHYVEVRVDDGTMSAADLDSVDGVITGCALGIAETGTIVLDGGRWQGRRMLSLVPDYHLCVVDAATVVGNVPEALRRLDPARPLTFVSGPSATSDIELERVEGVHGPRTLDVLLVE